MGIASPTTRGALTDRFDNAVQPLLSAAHPASSAGNHGAMKVSLMELKAAADALSALLSTKIAKLD